MLFELSRADLHEEEVCSEKRLSHWQVRMGHSAKADHFNDTRCPKL